jgi:hypothetical protein
MRQWVTLAQHAYAGLTGSSAELARTISIATGQMELIDQELPFRQLREAEDWPNLMRREDALREIHYGLISPLCRGLLNEVEHDLRLDPLVTVPGGRLKDDMAERVNALEDPRSRFAELWSYWPSKVVGGLNRLEAKTRDLSSGGEFWDLADQVVSEIGAIESLSNPKTHFKSARNDLAFQATSGSTLMRKFSEVLTRLYPEHGMQPSSQELLLRMRQSRFPEVAASMHGIHLESAVRVWSGCESSCYPTAPFALANQDTSAINAAKDEVKSSPHAQMFEHLYDGNLYTFLREHSTAAWFDTTKWSLYGSGNPWPNLDPTETLDPLPDLSGRRYLLNELETPPARKCPAVAFRAIRLLTEVMSPAACSPEVAGYAMAFWSERHLSPVNGEGQHKRALETALPLALAPSVERPRSLTFKAQSL